MLALGDQLVESCRLIAPEAAEGRTNRLHLHQGHMSNTQGTAARLVEYKTNNCYRSNNQNCRNNKPHCQNELTGHRVCCVSESRGPRIASGLCRCPIFNVVE